MVDLHHLIGFFQFLIFEIFTPVYAFHQVFTVLLLLRSSRFRSGMDEISEVPILILNVRKDGLPDDAHLRDDQLFPGEETSDQSLDFHQAHQFLV